MRRMNLTDAQRKALSERMKGKNNPMYGKKVTFSPEECKARSLRQQGENNTFFGKHHTDATKKKISDRNKKLVGEKALAWKGGTYVKNHNTTERRFIFREEILKRDSYTCLLCHYKSTKGMHVHHIDLDNSNNNLYNGITLCKYCHESLGIHNKKTADKWKLVLSILVMEKHK